MIRMQRLRSGRSVWPSVIPALFALLVLAAAAATLFGLPLWPLLAAAAVPWTVAASARMGSFAAIMGAVVATLWLVVAVLMLSPLTPVPMHTAVTAVWTLVGLAGAAMHLGRDVAVARPRRTTVVTWAPAALGGAFWIALSLVSAQLPGASRLALVVHGDSANNVLFARRVLSDNGIAAGPEENPVPLPAALLALALAPGRSAIEPGELLRHDLTAFTGVWAMVIAGVCLLAGVLAAAITSRAGGGDLTVAAVGAVVSFVPLSWIVTGYPLEFGFFNAHIALLVVLAAFAGYLVEERSPAHSLALLCLTATLLLTVWSPFVLLPAALALVVFLRHRRTLPSVRGWSAVFLLGSFAQLMLYGLLVVLPSFLALSGFLSAPGGAHSVPRWILGAVIICTIVLAIAAFRSPRHPVVFGVVAVSGGGLLGLALLLFISRNEPTPWTYYPLKYMWLITVVMLLLSLGVVAAAIVHRIGRRPFRIVALLAAATLLFAFVDWVPKPTTREPQAGPVVKLLRGEFLGHGDEVVDEITRLADPGQSHVLWRSGSAHEGTINFWLMQMWADSLEGDNELRNAAYGLYDINQVADLCRIIDLMDGGTIVHSADAGLGAELAGACPEVGAVVVSR
ncbi:hypothetical protein FVA74_04110 [Salinibacterium sp. dk2585]|uniref:hypothetical protein n=1 Tax=unclassified Salinibacterium TaxID=2632331 RepID=UPI0011C250E2|nr:MULTISPECIES: hypothetical protein [unclassified Salinibacterium]QEE60852.1 hypothetical protein FVA74_04110 [Salinibacterium sp. dk2585]TXK55924.1 hypothetical protein FVP63_04255 [Salinibacterium sp. dk5596]